MEIYDGVTTRTWMANVFAALVITTIFVIVQSSRSCQVTSAPCSLGINQYGKILEVNTTIVPGARAERFEFYPPSGIIPGAMLTRYGFLVRYPDAEATVIIAHGFKCDKFFAGCLRLLFAPGKYNIVTFDFRAHGEAVDGQYCTLGKHEAFDIATAARFIREYEGTRGKKLFVYGFSMGAVASIEAQASDASLFDGMILDCPFDSSHSLLKQGLSWLSISIFGYTFDFPGKRLLERCAYHPFIQPLMRFFFRCISNMNTEKISTYFMPVNTVDSMRKIKVPCLFIHCKNDEHISVGAVKRIYDVAQGGKLLYLTNGRGHFDSFFYTPERYSLWINNFLQSVMSNNFSCTREGIIEDEDDFFVNKQFSEKKIQGR